MRPVTMLNQMATNHQLLADIVKVFFINRTNNSIVKTDGVLIVVDSGKSENDLLYINKPSEWEVDFAMSLKMGDAHRFPDCYRKWVKQNAPQ